MQTITGDLLQDSLLHLLYCALKEEKPALPADLNWEALLQLANRQQVYNTVLPVLEKAAVLPPEKTRRWWGLAATLAVFVVANVYFSHERFAGTAAAELMPWLVAALVVVVFLCMVLEYGKKEEMDFTALCAILVAGAAIPLALSCLLRLRMLEHGAGLVLIPLVVYIGCSLFVTDSLVTGVSVLLAAMPAASTTAILAAKYEGDAVYASKCVVITTVLSLLATPLWSMILIQ